MIVNPPGDFITDPPLDYEDGDPPTLVPEADYCESPGKRLFYIEESDLSGLPSGGAICQNVRTVETHPAVIAANQSAHAAISAYASSNGIENPVWLYYRLVNVQYKPFDLSQADFDPPTITSDVSFVTFYTANVVVETDITLANFSGRISNAGPSTNLPANFDHFNGRTTFQNVLLFNDDHELESTFNMGGCLGCHGIAQVQNGTDFSFILSGGRVPVPETPNVDPPGTTNPAPVGLP
jgi:hypothetical protein